MSEQIKLTIYNAPDSIKIYEDLKKRSILTKKPKINQNEKINLNLSTYQQNLDCKYLENENIHSLNLSKRCVNKNLNKLKNVQHINLRGCVYLKNLDEINFNNLKGLNIENCIKVKNVDKCKNLENLNINGCHKIKDTSNLGKLKTLYMESCYNIKDIGNMRDLVTLSVDKPIYGLHLLRKLKNISMGDVFRYTKKKDKSYKFLIKLKKVNKDIKTNDSINVWC